MRRTLIILGLAMVTLSPVNGLAQATVDLQYQVEAARKLMEKERRLVVAGELALTVENRQAFWDVYNQYAEEIRGIDAERVQLIGDYARQFNSMTDDFARRMVADFFDQESRYLKTRQKYVRRFNKVLTPVEVARFYQVENKLDALFDFNLAGQIPLIGDGTPAGN